MDRETNHNVNKEKDKVCIIYIKKSPRHLCPVPLNSSRTHFALQYTWNRVCLDHMLGKKKIKPY